MPNDPFGARTDRPDAPAIYRLDRLAEAGVAEVSHLPRTVKILLENLLRQVGGAHVTEEDVTALATAGPSRHRPGRRCRSRRPGFCSKTSPARRRWSTWRPCARPSRGPAPTRARVDPLVPCDLVIDHWDLGIRIPPYFATEAQGDVRQMAGHGSLMTVLHVRDGALTRFDAIQEIPDVRV